MTLTATPTTDRDAQRALFNDFARTRSPRLRDELIEAHLGLASYHARRFSNRGEPLDDLIQVASMALVKAVDRFDPERGIEFATYATHTIVGELKRHFRDKGWALRPPRRLQELSLRVNNAIQPLTHSLGRSPTIKEIADEIRATEEDVLEAMEVGQAYRFTSLDAPSPTLDGEGSSLGDSIGRDDAEMDEAEKRADLSPLLDALPAREREIVYLRFYEGLTQSEIAARVGLSQMHISRLLARSLAELRSVAGA